MSSRKIYSQAGDPNELTIHITSGNELYVELYDPNDAYSFQNILLPLEDAREIISDLNEQLKLIDEQNEQSNENLSKEQAD
jgi:hypothetical protein